MSIVGNAQPNPIQRLPLVSRPRLFLPSLGHDGMCGAASPGCIASDAGVKGRSVFATGPAFSDPRRSDEIVQSGQIDASSSMIEITGTTIKRQPLHKGRMPTFSHK